MVSLNTKPNTLKKPNPFTSFYLRMNLQMFLLNLKQDSSNTLLSNSVILVITLTQTPSSIDDYISMLPNLLPARNHNFKNTCIFVLMRERAIYIGKVT